MSLINEMLQDLDARKQISEPAALVSSDRDDLLLADKDRSRLIPIIFGLVSAMIVGIFLVQHFSARFWSPQPQVPVELVQPEALPGNEKPEVQATEFEAAAPLEPPAQKPEREAVAVSDNGTLKEEKLEKTVEENEKADEINELLRRAEVALKQNRLSLPQGHSAYDLYRQVIAMDADNRQALFGLEQVKNQYIALLDNALEEKNPDRARALASRIENLSLRFDPSLLSGYRDQIQAQQLLAAAKTQPEKTTSIVEEEPKLAIHKTRISRELALAQEAQQLLAHGRGREAAMQLESFIAGNTTTNLSRMVLFDYYLGQMRIPQAEALLEPAYGMAPSTRAYMQARLAMISSGNAAAIALLEMEKPEPATAEIYNALLAGLYQKEKVHHKAVALYARLIETNPANVTYWLGMGVSRDALGEHQPALNAYNVVITHKNLDEDVRDFVKARIQALSSRDLAEAGVAW